MNRIVAAGHSANEFRQVQASSLDEIIGKVSEFFRGLQSRKNNIFTCRMSKFHKDCHIVLCSPAEEMKDLPTVKTECELTQKLKNCTEGRQKSLADIYNSQHLGQSFAISICLPKSMDEVKAIFSRITHMTEENSACTIQ